MTKEAENAFLIFDTNGDEGFSSDEVFQAFEYFSNKEKEIAVNGKKGDGVITNLDIEEIIKTDLKFTDFRAECKDDKKAANLLSKVLITFATLVQGDYQVRKISSLAIEAWQAPYSLCIIPSQRVENE